MGKLVKEERWRNLCRGLHLAQSFASLIAGLRTTEVYDKQTTIFLMSEVAGGDEVEEKKSSTLNVN